MNLEKILNRITGHEDRFGLEDRILNAMLFIASVIGTLSFIVDHINHSETESRIFSGLILLSLIAMYIIGRRKPSHKILVIPFCLVQMALILFVWYFFAGISGTSNVYILSFIFVIPIITKGWKRLMILLSFLAIATVILFAELKNPGLVHVYPDKQSELLDVFFSTIFIAIGVVSMIIIIIYSYNKQREQVEALNKTKDKFFSIIAHDLKGPLASLSSLGEYMWKSEDERDLVDQKRMEESIYRSSKNAHNLLENLLQWARSESGSISPSKQNVNLKQLVLENTALLKEWSSSKNIQIDIDIDDDFTTLADQNMLNLVLRNLISNAIKFTHTSGQITISAKLDEVNNQSVISVEDNGIGIEISETSNLFKLDSSYHRQGTNEEPGTGLGLKLCNEFISKQGGKISVDSTPGQGSTFNIYMPA